jgi:hypothetical protein
MQRRPPHGWLHIHQAGWSLGNPGGMDGIFGIAIRWSILWKCGPLLVVIHGISTCQKLEFHQRFLEYIGVYTKRGDCHDEEKIRTEVFQWRNHNDFWTFNPWFSTTGASRDFQLAQQSAAKGLPASLELQRSCIVSPRRCCNDVSCAIGPSEKSTKMLALLNPAYVISILYADILYNEVTIKYLLMKLL